MLRKSSKPSTEGPGNTESSVDPRTYLKNYDYPVDTPKEMVVEWVWFTVGKDDKHNPELMRGIPNNQVVFETCKM